MRRSFAFLLLPLLFDTESAFAQKQFKDELWSASLPIYQEIFKHPFLKGLTDGTLPEESFRYYIIQDALYLRDFARALAAAASKAPKDSWSILFAQHARDCLEAERSLHESFFKQWGLSEAEIYQTPMAPSNLAYTSYLLRVAQSGSFEELLGALLPCYWIYWEVGRELKAKGSPNPLYQRWIDTYGSENYGKTVEKVISIMEETAGDLSAKRKKSIQEHFFVSSRYEWMFWDAAWRLEKWPLP